MDRLMAFSGTSVFASKSSVADLLRGGYKQSRYGPFNRAILC